MKLPEQEEPIFTQKFEVMDLVVMPIILLPLLAMVMGPSGNSKIVRFAYKGNLGQWKLPC